MKGASVGKCAIAAMLLLGMAPPPAAEARPNITDIIEIPIHRGVNHIEKFTADGRAADITDAWRENLNAHSYHLFLVTTDAGVVGFDRDDAGKFWLSDTITDDPHTDEDVVTSVRFARARVNDVPATLVLTATRQWKETYYDAVPVEFVVFRLERNEECCGTPDVFRAISAETSRESYVNADDAIAKRFGLARWPAADR